MEKQVKSILLEQEQLLKQEPSEPVRQRPRKRKSNCGDTIALTGRDLRRIHTQQRLMRLRRLLEIEEILLENISREHN